MVKDRDKTSDPGEVGTELDLPNEDESSEPARPTSNMSFGMVDLGMDEPAGEKLPPPEEVKNPPAPKPQLPPKPPPQADFMQEAKTAQSSTPPPSTPPPASKPPSAKPPSSTPPPAAPVPYAIRSQRTTPSGGLPMAPATRLRDETSQTAEVRPAGLSRTIKIALILIVALVVIALGVFLYLRWQKNTEKERLDELDRLNQQSRDSLMDDRFKKD